MLLCAHDASCLAYQSMMIRDWCKVKRQGPIALWWPGELADAVDELAGEGTAGAAGAAADCGHHACACGALLGCALASQTTLPCATQRV